MKIRRILLLTACILSLPAMGQNQWTLRQCIEHALENNIQIQKSRISEEEGAVALKQDKAALLP